MSSSLDEFGRESYRPQGGVLHTGSFRVHASNSRPSRRQDVSPLKLALVFTFMGWGVCNLFTIPEGFSSAREPENSPGKSQPGLMKGLVEYSPKPLAAVLNALIKPGELLGYGFGLATRGHGQTAAESETVSNNPALTLHHP